MSGGYQTENPNLWSPIWLVMWVVIVVFLATLAFIASFSVWALTATVVFGIPELFAISKHGDSYPPLTHILRHYLPKWLTYTSLFAYIGTLGAYWFGAKHPTRMGALIGLVGWLIAHFDTVYDEN